MHLMRNLITLLLGHYATSSKVRGGGGHYNEQCHPGTYG